MEKRILLTGSNGFIGHRLAESFQKHNWDLLCLSKSNNKNSFIKDSQFQQINLAEETALLEEIFHTFRPTHIFNTAATSSVAHCQEAPQETMMLNVHAAEQLAKLSRAHDSHLIHFSTDFVYDGKQQLPYKEEDNKSPCNVYGESKLQAENRIVNSGCLSTILRVVLVYGPKVQSHIRNDFVSLVVNKLQEKENFQAVSDHIRMPTYLGDIIALCRSLINKPEAGIFNLPGADTVSVYEFALKVAEVWGLQTDLIQPITAESIGQHKNRPQNTTLDYSRAMQELGYVPTPLINALKSYKNFEHERNK